MISEQSKKCNMCLVVQPVSSFHRCNTRSKDGYAYSCKKCAYEKERSNPNRAAVKKRSAEKYKDFRNQQAREKNRQKRIAKYAARIDDHEAYTRYRAQRQLAKAAATPKWVTREDKRKNSGIYAAAAMLQELTCVQYDVDHIVPLQSDVVCGLNVWWNLQAIPQSLNAQKRNIFDPSLYLDQGKVAFPDRGRAVRRSVNATQMEDDYDE